MSRQNVDLAQRVYDAFVRRDLEAFFLLADADVEIIPRHSAVEGGTYRGHDGVRSWWENLFGVFPDFRGEVEEVRDPGDPWILAAIRIWGRGTSSAVPFEDTVWVLTEWRDEKCVSWRTFEDEDEALESRGESAVNRAEGAERRPR